MPLAADDAPAAPPVVGTDIASLARRAGAYAWLELRLFELLGAWASGEGSPAVKAAMAVEAHRHGWHTELWHRRLPELAELRPQDAVRPADHGVAAALHALSGTAGVPERLGGLVEVVLPRVRHDYEAHLAVLDARVDGPTVRVLELCLADLGVELRRFGSLLEEATTAEAADGRVALTAAQLRGLLGTPG